MTIPLQPGIIYGPVNSRRLGRSLGINLLPVRLKICTFNCVYCQYGWTKIHDQKLADESLWPSTETIVEAVRQALQTVLPPPAYLTFSGNGEPSLHPAFAELVEEVIRLRDRYAPSARTAILSNSTTIFNQSIREAIARLDVPIMKLDCGTEKCFQTYNRPCQGIELSEIVRGLRAMENVTIQSLFSEGAEGNFYPENISSWIDQLKIISPRQVQIYTLDRGYPSDQIFPVTQEKLIELGDRLRQEKIKAEVFCREKKGR
jgi:wyosine [tRNA(Phe)-imidazoG37] synthetase (radical SAM superfamily)